jgi:hypothetical protein
MCQFVCILAHKKHLTNCLTRTTYSYILCIEHPRRMRLSRESDLRLSALQANTLCKQPSNGVISCYSEPLLFTIPVMSWWKGVQVWIVSLSAGLQCILLLILSILSAGGHGLCPKGACNYNLLKN